MSPHLIEAEMHRNHATVVGGLTGRPATGRRLLILTIVIPLLLSIVGCDSTPAGADRALDQMTAEKIYTDPPPGNAMPLAQGRDRGTASDITSRPPCVVSAYALSATVDDVVTHYQTSYRQYHWRTGHYLPEGAPDGIELDAESDWIRIHVYVGPAPYHLDYPAVAPSAAPTDHPTYLTILLCGLPHT